MAKRKKSQIQRRNLPKTAPVLHPSLENNKRKPSEESAPAENTFLFTMIGMFSGMLIGLYFNNMAAGFGIGILIGGIIDFFLNKKRKKEEAPENESIS